jgi:Carboxypeptidase regulatory-like domain/TonB dependent receptor/TonB-dependent Receptor Plug Domain
VVAALCPRVRAVTKTLRALTRRSATCITPSRKGILLRTLGHAEAESRRSGPFREFVMKCPALVLIFLFFPVAAFTQTEGARISGRVTDPSDAVIVGADCTVTNLETGVPTTTTTNQDGIYVLSNLRPATYQLAIKKEGFRTVVQPSLQLYVQDAVNENFTLALGPVSETSTVVSDALLQTDSAAVSTVVDQQFVRNMPLNGRSFQSLIALTPGVVFTSQQLGQGQFSVNGQRSNANYFMVDGVSANFGITIGGLNQTLGGAIPAFTAQGGTNGLVSVDAMQEFRIQTSSYAAEYGRTPGAQISIVTKSGTNQFHGTVFDYLRNDIFDARNYFDAPPLTKPPLRQNDFGGTVGGPIFKDKTFFFFSYEGLRLRMPQTASDSFLTASARAATSPVYQPVLKALPLPSANAPLIDPSCDNVTDPCLANINAVYSDPSSLNSTSIRVDHNLTGKVSIFARYSHAPSYSATRFWEEQQFSNFDSDAATAGVTALLGPTKVNDFRANWGRNGLSFVDRLTDFYGAVAPPASVMYPPSSPFSFEKGQALVFLESIGDGNMEIREGAGRSDIQRQINFLDTFSWAVGAHQLKFGVDYRRLNPTVNQGTGYAAFPTGYADLTAGVATAVLLDASQPVSVSVNNYSLFAQDTWKTTNHLTLTYGLRWEINTPPVSTDSTRPLYAVQGIFDSSPLALVNRPLWRTKFDNFAPRIGAAYQLTPKTIVRGGFGVFYDLGYGDFGDAFALYPYQQTDFLGPLPFDPSSPAYLPPPLSTTINANIIHLSAVDPKLSLPFTLQWNAAVERELGQNQTFTATYVGSDGRRLLREDVVHPPVLLNFGNGGSVNATRNVAYAHYNALQLQFQRRMSHGLQALVSYNLSNSSDLGSTDVSGLRAGNLSEIALPPLRPSDFDVRNSAAAAISYEIPTPSWGRAGSAILKGWAADGLLRVTSAPPINVYVQGFSPGSGVYVTEVDVVPGHPYWIADPTQPSGRALNPAAFTAPPVGEVGDFPRNELRSPYSINQTDLALRRRFDLTETVKLDVRAEYFNVFNHPMFGIPGSQCNPDAFWGVTGGTARPTFGKVCPGISTTNVDAGSGGSNAQSSLYALGGPRSAQFTLKLIF